MTPALGYLRVSTEDQAQENRTSLAQQRAAITALAGRLGVAVEAWFEDPGASGGSADRPGFQALLAYCRAHRRPTRAAGYVLVLNDSRWGRFTDPDEAHFWRFTFKGLGWIVRFAESDDTDDLMTRSLLRALHSSQASAYREQLRRTAARGARGTAAQGWWQTREPFAYRRLAIARDGRERVLAPGQRKSNDERVKLVPGPEDEVTFVRWAFARYAAGGISLGRLATEALARFPRRRWSKQGIRCVLENPAYQGDVVWCRRPADRPERLALGGRRPPEAWVETRDAHPALVERSTWALVQTRLRLNQRETRPTQGGYPLSGLIRCAHCGEVYVGGGGPKGPPDEPDRYRFYRHASLGRDATHRRQPSACPALFATLPRRVVDRQVVRAIAAIVAAPAHGRLIRALAPEVLQEERSAVAIRRRELEATRANLTARRERAVALATDGVLTEAEIRRTMDGLRAELEEVEAARQALRFVERATEASRAERERLLALAESFEAAAETLDGATLRELLRPWIASCVADRVHHRLELQVNLAIRPIQAVRAGSWEAPD